MPSMPPSRSPSAVFGSHEHMPTVSFLMPNDRSDTIGQVLPRDDWYCPSPPPDTRPRFAFFPVETETAAQEIAALDPLDEPVAFPHLAQKPNDAKRKGVQTVFFKS